MRRLQQDEPCVAQFGLVEAGTVCNAVAGEARLAGSLRVFSDEMFERTKAELTSTLEMACSETGCTYEIDFAEGYPPVTNDAELYAACESALPELTRIDDPLLIAEDFAFYQRYVPGVFFLLGVGEPEVDGSCGELGHATCALHGDTLMFDEHVLLRGISVYRQLLQMR